MKISSLDYLSEAVSYDNIKADSIDADLDGVSLKSELEEIPEIEESVCSLADVEAIPICESDGQYYVEYVDVARYMRYRGLDEATVLNQIVDTYEESGLNTDNVHLVFESVEEFDELIHEAKCGKESSKKKLSAVGKRIKDLKKSGIKLAKKKKK